METRSQVADRADVKDIEAILAVSNTELGVIALEGWRGPARSTRSSR